MIEVRNLTFEYPTSRALTDVSFTIPEGSITALVGPNGAGKTTLMKCLAALEKPFTGSITIDGVDIVENPRQCHRMLGFLPDFFGLYDDLTVAQSLEYFARAHDVPESELQDRVHDIARRMNLADKITSPVTGLSRGMRQRLAIGQTMIQNPKYLILDEPASGLDPEARYALGEEFIRLNSEGLTLIVSSHILAELDQYATDLLILREGRVIEHTSAAKLAESSSVLEIALTEPMENLEALLSSMPHVEHVSVHGLGLRVRFEGDEKVQQELLRSLIAAGVPVKEFFVKKVSLQDQYLDQVKEG